MFNFCEKRSFSDLSKPSWFYFPIRITFLTLSSSSLFKGVVKFFNFLFDPSTGGYTNETLGV